MLIQTHQRIQASFTDCQCLLWGMSFIILVGTHAALAMVMLLLIDAISCYHPLCKNPSPCTFFLVISLICFSVLMMFFFAVSEDLVASMRLTQRQTRGHRLCISMLILKRLLKRLGWRIHTQLIVLPLVKSWCPVLETKRETPREMGFSSLTLISTSRIGILITKLNHHALVSNQLSVIYKSSMIVTLKSEEKMK